MCDNQQSCGQSHLQYIGEKVYGVKFDQISRGGALSKKKVRKSNPTSATQFNTAQYARMTPS